MVDKIKEAMSTYANALKLRGVRQDVISGNLANADTPNYKAVDFDFAKALNKAKQSAGGAMAGGTGSGGIAAGALVTHPKHLTLQGKGPQGGNVNLMYRTVEKKSLDNNTVDIDMERSSFAENTVKYEAAGTSMSGLIKTMRSAITGE